MKNYFLHPGSLFYSSESVDVVTVLGSCVSVCIYDRHLKTGGICHYYLPYEIKSDEPPNRYGDFAIPNLLKKFKKGGSKQEHLTAKVIGGGKVLQSNERNLGIVGLENVRLAKKLLAKFKIEVVTHSTGGIYGRKIRFNTFTGEIKQKKIITKKNVMAGEIGKKITVMIVDDSKTIRKIIKTMIEKDPCFSVLHEAENPMVAEKMIQDKRPDVITLDIKMPVMDGVTYLNQYMAKNPIPTIIVTSLNYNDSGPVFRALELGAIDYLRKPNFNQMEALTLELHAKLKNAYSLREKVCLKKDFTIQAPIPAFKTNRKDKYLIAIGASTGGTQAIKELLLGLPSNIPPVLIVLHIPPVFSKAYAERMNSLCDFEVKEAENGDEIKSGRVLLAPGGKQMKVVERKEILQVQLTDDAPVNKFKPSVDYLFHSLAGMEKKVIGVLLTGMGTDGASGLLRLKQREFMTIAQDEATSAVFGMPKAAMELGAVVKTGNLQTIPKLIVDHIEKSGSCRTHQVASAEKSRVNFSASV